ncbi:MAG: response regulator [Gemmataceae bacterium]|nr:response regulator [Gemmataceae bacterium]MCI0742604.1 response regulator [Gemmataceae bacterium]
MSELAKPIALLLCDDLLFSSSIQGHARHLGIDLRTARTPEDLMTLAQSCKPRLVLVDVHTPGLSIADAARELKEISAPAIVAYGSHVQGEVLQQAREAGCDLVLPRSRFVADMPSQLASWAELGKSAL